MLVYLETWQAITLGLIFACVFCWSGYATSKVFAFSKRDLKQRKQIRSLKLLVEHIRNSEMESVIINGRTDGERNKNNTVVKK